MDVDRPQMVAGYGIAGTSDGTVAWEWVVEQLSTARNYWIVTSRDAGRPHAMPVWGLWLDDAMVFSTDPESVKGRNLARRPELVVHLESGDDVVIVEGRAERVDGARLPDGFVDAYGAKYGHRVDTSDPMFGFYRVAPPRVLTWREADFPTSATRFTF
jgi:hypothetical protein